MKDNKVLVLGGKPIGSVELVNRLHKYGAYVIVTDYLPKTESPAKKIADETWDISTADIQKLVYKIKESGVTAIMTAVHEFNINRMLDLCEIFSFPSYCNKDTWKYCDNKALFKRLCLENQIPVAQTYNIEDVQDNSFSQFPIIVKPVDGSGSRGFHICNDLKELEVFYKKAAEYSPSNTVLIEKYIPYDSVIIHYTMIGGKCIYSGISDKISVKFKSSGASVMGIQTFPSKGESAYLANLNEKVVNMFENAGFSDGPIWIEAFFDGKNDFIFNEMGYRFGGSLTYYPVKYFTGIDQLDLMIGNALSRQIESEHTVMGERKNYCILPIHINPGKITKVQIPPSISKENDYVALVQVHFENDTILEWGSAQQVFAYAHILYKDGKDLLGKSKTLLSSIKVLDENGNNMIHTLFDLKTLSI
ncbi:MAG: ATP-grasp domain-containing protein [Muribaculaceae bacterium]|nr:ATP-grasp domain-containing protein [Muribaculaceae bacterium]